MCTTKRWLLVVCLAAAWGCGSDGAGSDGGAVVCGDGEVEGDEQCDDGNTVSGDGCDFECFDENAVCGDGEVGGREECDGEEGCLPATHIDKCTWTRTAFRFKDLKLVDPVLRIGCDGDLGVLIGPPLSESTREDNGPKVEALLPELEPDGLIDLGFVFAFANIDQGDGAQGDASFVLSDCNVISSPSPEPNPSPCAPTVSQEPSETPFVATTHRTGTCLESMEGTTTAEVDSVEAGDYGCWVSDTIDFQVLLGSVASFPLTNARLAGQFDADPASNLVNGLIAGFIDKEAADGITIDLDALGTKSLTNWVNPSPETCDYSDVGPNGENGFWFYLSFEAEVVPWKGGLMCGDGDIDEDRPVLGPEECDPKIASGDEGVCTSLDVCINSLCASPQGGDSCAPQCYFYPKRADDCCIALDFPGTQPGAAGALLDPDCYDLCGNGIVDDFEGCDVDIDSGMPGACDAEGVCDDGNACTVDALSTFNECVCSHSIPISPESDGCCRPQCLGDNPPPACSTDPDCS